MGKVHIRHDCKSATMASGSGPAVRMQRPGAKNGSNNAHTWVDDNVNMQKYKIEKHTFQ